MSGEGHHVPGSYKALELEPAGLELAASPSSDGAFDLVVKAEALALFVLIESGTPGRYSDNAFDLAAGESRSIRFTPAVPTDAIPQFRIYDLYSCQAAG